MSVELDLWDETTPAPPGGGQGLYVAVSGNTAAGKSSLVSELESRLLRRGRPAIGVSERAFHHPYLRLMFREPDAWAFPIQLTFMLQRHMVLLRNLVGLRRDLILERSHFDDILFLREHVRSGRISEDQREAYEHLAAVLHARIPVPDVLVLMNPTPETSLRRLARAEEAGERPREFPSEAAKAAWVERWYEMYVELHREFREKATADPAWADVTLVEVDAGAERGASADEVEAAVLKHLGASV